MTAAAPLEVQGLTKHFAVGSTFARSRVHAVDDVSFELRPGTITALVGESGSGKSTVARLLARLHDPTSGSVLWEGGDVTRVRRRRDVLRYRSQVQLIFQDPFASLNPVKTVRHHIERPLRLHDIVPASGIEERVHELLRTVGLVPPEQVAAKYPHEILVMYAGQIVERGPVEEVLADPLHPYTRLLLAAVPDPGAPVERIELRKGLASAAVDPAAGCRFVARCPLAIDACSHVTPEL